MKIRLNASNLAALLGKNPYVSRADAFLSAWRSTDRRGYEDAHARNSIQSIEDRRREIAALPAVSTVVDASALAVRRDFSTLTNEERDEARRLVYTRLGDERERSVLATLNTLFPEARYAECDTFFSKTVGRHAGHEIVLQGKIDARSADGQVVVECKTRMHRLALKVREYERLQVLAYLELTGARSALLVEAHFPPGAARPDINVDTIRPDSAWLDHALLAGRAVARLVDDPAMQDEFMLSAAKTDVIRRLVVE